MMIDFLDAGLREQMMWKSLADNIKNESDLALVKANGTKF